MLIDKFKKEDLIKTFVSEFKIKWKQQEKISSLKAQVTNLVRSLFNSENIESTKQIEDGLIGALTLCYALYVDEDRLLEELIWFLSKVDLNTKDIDIDFTVVISIGFRGGGYCFMKGIDSVDFVHLLTDQELINGTQEELLSTELLIQGTIVQLRLKYPESTADFIEIATTIGQQYGYSNGRIAANCYIHDEVIKRSKGKFQSVIEITDRA